MSEIGRGKVGWHKKRGEAGSGKEVTLQNVIANPPLSHFLTRPALIQETDCSARFREQLPLPAGCVGLGASSFPVPWQLCFSKLCGPQNS